MRVTPPQVVIAEGLIQSFLEIDDLDMEKLESQLAQLELDTAPEEREQYWPWLWEAVFMLKQAIPPPQQM